MRLRAAVPSDAEGIAAVLSDLVAAGKRTRPSDAAFVRNHYLQDVTGIECLLAEDDGVVLGFQSLKMADADNPYGTPVGWGIIGTHIRPTASGRGIGRGLFEATLRTAREAGLASIEAYINERNAAGRAYYEAMGFRTYRHGESAVAKRYDLNLPVRQT